jgi:hypothetical protein
MTTLAAEEPVKVSFPVAPWSMRFSTYVPSATQMTPVMLAPRSAVMAAWMVE